jgi:hypothetical protein
MRGARIAVSMDTTKKLAFVCLLLFLLTTGATAFHYHDGDCSHDDCPICVAAFIISTASLSFFIFAVFILVFVLETCGRSSCHVHLGRDLPLSRAPPA